MKANDTWQPSIPSRINTEMAARHLRPTGEVIKQRGLSFHMAEGGRGLAYDAKKGCYVMWDSLKEGASDPTFFGYSQEVLE